MQKLKVKLPECDYCHKTANQLIRFLWKQKRIKLDLCPSCYADLHSKHLKEIDISTKTLMASGLYEQGVRAIDIKSYLEKWAKQLKDKL